MTKNKKDTPLVETPEIEKVTDLKTALTDIQKRSDIRRAKQEETSKLLRESRKSGKNTYKGEPKLVGLKGFGSYKVSYKKEINKP